MNSNARLLIKSSVKFAHQAGYYLLNGRWHKLQTGKPAPKGAPVAHVPHAAGQHLPATLTSEQVEQLKYPAEKAAKNPEMQAFNEKHLPELLGHAANGDATAILGSSYGVNTHGKKKALIANHLLAQMGSPHKVAPGQKAGEHAAVKAPAGEAPAAPAEAPSNPTEAGHAEGDKWVMPLDAAIAEHKELVHTAETPSKADDKAQLAEQKEELGKMEAAKDGAAKPVVESAGEAHATKAPVSVERYGVAGAKGSAGAGVFFAPKGQATSEYGGELHAFEIPVGTKLFSGESSIDFAEKHGLMDAADPDVKKITGLSTLAEVIEQAGEIDNDKLYDAFQTVAKRELEKAGFQGAHWSDEDELNPDQYQLWGVPGASSEYGPKDGDTKPAADGGTLVLKDGHWVKQGGDAASARGLNMPAFTGGTVGQSVIDYYEKQAQKVMDLAAAGNLLELQQMAYNGLKPNANGKVSNTWAGKTPNSKLFIALHAKALEQAKGGAAPAAAPAATAPEIAAEKPPAPKPPRLVIPKATPKPAGNTNLAQIPWHTFKVGEGNSNAKSHNPAVDKIKALAEAGDLAGLQAFHEKKAASKQTYAQKQAKLAKLAILALQEPSSAPASTTAQAEPAQAHGAAPAGSLLAQINFDASLLPASNSNAKSHNGAVEKIKAMALAGDVAGLQAFVDAKAGAKQTYAKKQHLLASAALAALKEWAPARAQNRQSKSTEQAKLPHQLVGNADPEASLSAAVHKLVSGKIPSVSELVAMMSLPKDDVVKLSAHVADEIGKVPSQKLMASALAEAQKEGYKGGATWPWKTPDGKSFDTWSPSPGVVDELLSYSYSDVLFGSSGSGESAAPAPAPATPIPPPVTPEDEATAAAMKAAKEQISQESKSTIDELAAEFSYGGEAALHAILQSTSPGSVVHEYAKQKISEATAKLNAGPQEGDTKVVGGVTYVLQNGRWHKQGGDLDETTAFQLKTWSKMGKPTKGAVNAKMQAAWDQLSPSQQFEIEKQVDKDTASSAVAAEPAAPAIPEPPQFSSVGGTTVWAERYAKVAKALHEKVLTEGAAAFKGVVVSHADGRFTITLANFKLKKFGPTDKQEYRQQMHAYVTALKAAVGKAPKATKQKAAPASGLTPAPAPAAPLIESMDAWSQTGPQGGSNPGGRFKDAAGVEWYCKFPADDDVAKSEVLAAKLYSALGIAAQDAKLVTKNGKLGIASRWVDVKKGGAATLAKTDGVRMGFAADAWLANWDVVGLGYDNLQIGADGKAVRVDAGGSLEYRAQGGKKAFGTFVTEIDSLRDPKINPQAAAVFGGMTDADITASVAKVLQISDAHIRAMVAEFGPGDTAAKKALADTLIARKADLAAKYPKAVKAPAKKVLDPAALPVNPEQLPKRHDFANWNGPGKGLSSKEHVNKANSDVEDQLYALAKVGNLTALKTFHFQPVDKETGAPSGHPVPIAKHPSKHVVQLHDDLVQMLEEIANPPEPLKVFRETDVSTIDGLAAAFPPKPFGTTASKVSSNEKLGFWVALGAVKGAAKKFAPPSPKNFTQQAIAAAYDKFKAASSLAKHFVHSVQASGSYNDLFRNGAEKDHSGHKLSDVAKAALELATEQPEGTTVYRWQNMSDDMVKKVLAAQEGTVFQATGPMCTSYDPTATKHFGPHRVVFRYAKGAKAVESFGSGGFKSEKEITTLPNSRFVILSKKMVPDTEHGNPNKQRLELEVLMLPPDLGIQ